ncbi:MAG: CaiB/BaiF CoA transferase family protein [Hyphomicrobiaceae bacterium]
MTEPSDAGPLDGVRVLDLSRILAGPSATQVLGDLGADVIKIEHPERGDDTRKWGPPFIRDDDGNETSESSYYASANRNKRSVAIDIAQPAGAELVRDLAQQSDILVENFKVGGLAKYGLDYESLQDDCPHLIYCSITGFGQTGPYAPRAGYDFLIQAMGGLMSITGEPHGAPMKTGVAVADLMAGMYAVNGILAALYGRDCSPDGVGQHIDISLLDTQIAWLSNVGMHALVSGETPPRLGNAHASIVPYRVFEVADGHVVIAVGNDRQFATWCVTAGCPELATDDRFRTNEGRVRNRKALEDQMETIMQKRSQADWIAAMEAAGVPCGPVNTIDQVFDDPHVQTRGMQIVMPHARAAGGTVPQIASPLQLSGTPVTYRNGPPVLGEHTDEVLQNVLRLNGETMDRLRRAGVIKSSSAAP